MSKRRRSSGGPSDGGPSDDDSTPRPTAYRRQDGGPADGPSGHRPRPTACPRQDGGPADGGPSGHRVCPTQSPGEDGGQSSGHQVRPTPSRGEGGGPSSGHQVRPTPSRGEGGGPSDGGGSHNERRLDPADGTVQTLQEMIQKYWKYNYGNMAIETYFEEYCLVMASYRPPDLRSNRGSMAGAVPPGRDPRMERRRAIAALRCAGCKAMPYPR